MYSVIVYCTVFDMASYSQRKT